MAMLPFSTPVMVPKAKKLQLRNFVIPTRYTRTPFDIEKTKVCAIIPTFKPGRLTLRLIEDLLRWNTTLQICIVDDCTPQSHTESLAILESIRSLGGERVHVIRTPINKLKAGALNYGLRYMLHESRENSPDVVVTLDDDVVIEESTVRNLVTELMSNENFGAACSQCHALNKNKNFLTRLQGLEYIGFNATRLADEGFFRGPLVMHGMLTAFRTSALRTVGEFAEGHLIEDYEITARLKTIGWSVKSVINAHAWTFVPERFGKLWKQRTRWSYGGITVIDGVKYLPAVLQDVIGHGMFWATVCTIDLLILGTIFASTGQISPEIPRWIIALSLTQLGIWYVFQLWLMRFYKEKDIYDWLIRISLVPEFIYSNILTLVLVGSYFFLFFNILTRGVKRHGGFIARSLESLGRKAFRIFGYTKGWGTRSVNS